MVESQDCFVCFDPPTAGGWTAGWLKKRNVALLAQGITVIKSFKVLSLFLLYPLTVEVGKQQNRLESLSGFLLPQSGREDER